MIATLTQDGHALPVVSGTVSLPRIGAWVADLVVDADTAPALAAATLTLGERVYAGTVIRSGMVEGVARVRVAAGAGGASKVVTPAHFSHPDAMLVARALLRGVGESLDAGAATALSARLDRWTVVAAPAGAALRALLGVAAPAAAWRYLASGAIWVGVETWPAAEGFADVFGAAPEDGIVDIVLTGPPPEPGTTAGGRRVDGVQLRLTGQTATARIWVA